MKTIISKILNYTNLSSGEDDKLKVLENVKSNISFRGANLWILACAIVIASIGLNVNSAATVGIAVELKKNAVKCKLKLPVCADPGSKVTISRKIGNRFRLIGYGEIVEK